MGLEALASYLASAGARRLADGEWGLSLPDVGGWPLDVGVRLARGVLRAQAFVAPCGLLDEHELLFRNRSLVGVRYAHTGSGDVWVVGDLFADALSEGAVDRLLGLLVQAAGDARGLVGA